MFLLARFGRSHELLVPQVCPSTVLGLVTPLLHGFVDASVSGKSTAALWTAQAQLFSDIHQLIENQEECLPHLQGDSFTLENPQPSHFKEEEEYPQPPYFKEEEEEECLLAQEEADLSKFPLTVVSVKTEEHEDKPPESSQLHHSPMEKVWTPLPYGLNIKGLFPYEDHASCPSTNGLTTKV
ncbi:uncharacterized protein LOC133545004 isoform X3 [Nerophis ophidion]|uniref:uncharacterized protein LOC133545004 isoform X3 n=1 Tax=Nerophis ophidion TaxID=159077 RepID=UPI002AE039E6|nr:uncharacterized protein LOC133545004 isoform X3 [Nerophis ophidion]